MIEVGLTGNRYSGKSTVAKLFRQMNVKVFDADIVLKYIINYNKDVIASIRNNMGVLYVYEDYIEPNSISSDAVFDRIIDLAETELFDAYSDFKKNIFGDYIVFKSSILFERGWEKHFDYTINTYKNIDERALSMSNKEDCSLLYAKSVLENETSEIDKNAISDYIIHNYIGAISIEEQLLYLDSNLRVLASDIIDVY